MSLIGLPFSPEMAEKVLAGEKCCTSRRDLKGVPGDEFEVGGVRFRILDVARKPLADVAFDLCRLEGFHNATSCGTAIRDIYPEMDGGSFLYVHFFARCP